MQMAVETALGRSGSSEAAGRGPGWSGLVRAELLKWRRSAFPWIALGGSLVVPIISAVALLATGTAHVTPDRSLMTVLGFMATLPSGIVAALIATQVFGAETDADTWKLVLTQPVSRARVFAVKTGIAVTAMFCLTVLAGALAMALLRAVGVSGPLAVGPWLAMFALSAVGFVVLMPAYHLVSLAARSYMATIGVSIAVMIAGMVGSQTKFSAFLPAYLGLSLGGHISWITAHDPMAHSALTGGPAAWLIVDAALFVGALVAGWVYGVRADFR